MDPIITCLKEQHDLRFVAVAAIICLTSSLITMILLGNCSDRKVEIDIPRLLASISVCSIGIWATHFVAILVYDVGVPVTYGAATTGISALFYIFTVAFGLYIGVYYNSVVSHFLGGLYLGLGIAVMHLLGMFAIRSISWMIFDLPTTYFAILAGCLFAGAALVMLVWMQSVWRYVASSLLLVVGVCSLHFISMSWTQFYIPPFYEESVEEGLNSAFLAAAVFSVWSMVVGFAAVKYILPGRSKPHCELEGVLVGTVR